MKYYAVINNDLDIISSWISVSEGVSVNLNNNESICEITKPQAELIGEKVAEFNIIDGKLEITKLNNRKTETLSTPSTTLLTDKGILKQEIADLAFQNMLLEHELKQLKQSIAELKG